MILFQGMAIGFSIAVPIGPVNILCIRRTLLSGRKNGLATGFGAATADAVFGSIGAFGLTFISEVLVAQQFWLRLLGGVFLCYLGARAVFSKVGEQTNRPLEGNLRKDYSSSLLLAITNPMAILYFAAIFSTLGGTSVSNYSSSSFFVSGVFLGSMVWWLILTSALGIFLKKFDVKKLRIVNLVSGMVIIGFGSYFLLSLVNIFH